MPNDELLDGQGIELKTGAIVAMARFEGGFVLQFTNRIEGIASQDDLLNDPTCKCQFVDGVVNTNIAFSEEAMDALFLLYAHFKREGKEAADAQR